ERPQAVEVLLGEELGRREERGLASRLGDRHAGVEAEDGLARADVALEQAAHREGARAIGAQLRGDRALAGGRRAGGAREEALVRGEVDRRGERAALVSGAAAELEARLEAQERLQREAAARGAEGGLVLRIVGVADRARERRQREARQDPCRERLLDAAGEL